MHGVFQRRMDSCPPGIHFKISAFKQQRTSAERLSDARPITGEPLRLRDRLSGLSQLDLKQAEKETKTRAEFA
jgi:hypothetical protein